MIPNLPDVGDDFPYHFLLHLFLFGGKKLTNELVSIWTIKLNGCTQCPADDEHVHAKQAHSDPPQIGRLHKLLEIRVREEDEPQTWKQVNVQVSNGYFWFVF